MLAGYGRDLDLRYLQVADRRSSTVLGRVSLVLGNGESPKLTSTRTCNCTSTCGIITPAAKQHLALD